MPTPLTEMEIIQRLLLAAALGGAIGLEREWRKKSAGFRTNILIAMGSAVFTILSMTLADASADPTRIAAQIVTGIGFLGAGAILHTQGSVLGLTTAATIWVNAALGMAAGAGQGHLAISAAAITLLVLLALGPVEAAFERRVARSRGVSEPRA